MFGWIWNKLSMRSKLRVVLYINVQALLFLFCSLYTSSEGELNPNTNTDDLFYTQLYDKRSKFSCEEKLVTSQSWNRPSSSLYCSLRFIKSKIHRSTTTSTIDKHTHLNTHAVDNFINNYMIWISQLIKPQSKFLPNHFRYGKINFYFS